MSPPSHRTWRAPVHLLPAEILSMIFLLVVNDEYNTGSRVPLMLVCRHWYAVVLSTPGILSVLRVGNSTAMEMVRAAIQGTRWLLEVVIRMDGESIGQDFNADTFDACFMSAIEATSRCKSLWIFSFPPPGGCKAFQIVPPSKNSESFCLSKDPDIRSFFELFMAAVTTTAAPRLTDMRLYHRNAVLYLVQPDCLHVFCSLTVLSILLSKKMESPVNILPHLQRLESFRARRLYLPIYPPDAHLPLIQTLLYLSLQSVSIQWMAGKVFPVLQECSITFPHQIDTLYLQPVAMPACTSLAYCSNDLNPLRCFYALPPLAELAATSGQWNVTRGNLQLMTICHIIVPHAQSLTKLDLQVRCSGQLLIHMLSLLPALKDLQLRLASPSALNETFFQAFIASKSNADSPCGISGVPSLSLCSNLVELNLKYKRWLRDPERTALLLVLGDIASSRRSKEGFQLHLSFEDHAQQGWIVLRHVHSIHEVSDGWILILGISSPHGIIPLAVSGWGGCKVLVLAFTT